MEDESGRGKGERNSGETKKAGGKKRKMTEWNEGEREWKKAIRQRARKAN